MAEESATTPVDAGRPRRRRRALRVLGWALAVVLALALVGTGYGVWTVRRSFPTTSGTLSVAGLAHDATVRRDARGIPTITAETPEDLFFAQGYVHAQDRFWEMDFRRHLTSGRLSELFGESQVPTDTFLRTLGWRRVAEREVEALSPTTRTYYESYAAGVNAYLADHRGAGLSLEHALLGLQNPDYAPEPWEPADSVAWLKAMAWDLVSNVGDEEARALEARFLDDDALAELYPGYPFDEHLDLQPGVGLHRHGQQRDRERRVPVPPGRRLGLRLPRRPHRRTPRGEARRRAGQRRRPRRDPARQPDARGGLAQEGVRGRRARR